MNWEIGIDIYTQLCIKQIANGNLPMAQEEKKKVQSVCKAFNKLTLKMHSNIQ